MLFINELPFNRTVLFLHFSLKFFTPTNCSGRKDLRDGLGTHVSLPLQLLMLDIAEGFQINYC